MAVILRRSCLGLCGFQQEGLCIPESSRRLWGEICFLCPTGSGAAGGHSGADISAASCSRLHCKHVDGTWHRRPERDTRRVYGKGQSQNVVAEPHPSLCGGQSGGRAFGTGWAGADAEGEGGVSLVGRLLPGGLRSEGEIRVCKGRWGAQITLH